MGSFGGVRENHLWWLVLRDEDGIPGLAATASLLSKLPLYKNQIAHPDSKLEPYKALVQLILKEKRKSAPTQDKDGSSQPQEKSLHKIWGVGGRCLGEEIGEQAPKAFCLRPKLEHLF